MKAILLSSLLSGGILLGINTNTNCEEEIASLNEQIELIVDEISLLQSDQELNSIQLDNSLTKLQQVSQENSFITSQNNELKLRIKELENELANCGKNK